MYGSGLCPISLQDNMFPVQKKTKQTAYAARTSESRKESAGYTNTVGTTRKRKLINSCRK